MEMDKFYMRKIIQMLTKANGEQLKNVYFFLLGFLDEEGEGIDKDRTGETERAAAGD